MSYIEYFRNHSNYQLSFNYPLNLVTGLSSTGKTNLLDGLVKHSSCMKSSGPVFVNIPYTFFETLPENSIVLLDMEEYDKPDAFDWISKCKRNDCTFVLFGRKWAARVPIAICNTFKFETVKGVTKNTPLCKDSTFFQLNTFKEIYTEDSKSGFLFFAQLYDKVISAQSKDNVCRLVSIDNLVVFDSVGFGANIEEFLDIVKHNSDFNYICWTSFEGFILETLFNDTRELPHDINIESALVKRLLEYNKNYSKDLSCTGTACSMCKNTCKTSSKALLNKSIYKDLLKHVYCDYTKEQIDWCRAYCADVHKDLDDKSLWEIYRTICLKLM